MPVALLAGILTIAFATACSGETAGTQTTPSAAADSTDVASSPLATEPPSPTVAAPVTPRPTTNSASAEAPSPQTSAATDFEIKLFQGGDVLGADELRLSDVIGRPLVLNFWARLCGPCWSEMPDLQDFYEEHQGEVELLGVDLGQFTGLGLPKDASKLLDALGVTYPAGYTDDAHVVRGYGVRAMPTTVFISSDGNVFQTWTGAIERQQLEAIVAEMLEKD